MRQSISFFGGNTMEEIIVRGGKQLNGTVHIEGALRTMR
jgi:hypothetical protein